MSQVGPKQLQDAARTWAAQNNVALDALSPLGKRAVVADVAAQTGASQTQVTEALLSIWTHANEIRGRTFDGGGPTTSAATGFRPMSSVNGHSPMSMLLTNKSLPNVATFQPVPDDSNAHKLANEGFALDKAGQHQKAIALYEKALVEEPTDPMIRNRLGLATKHLGAAHLDKALAFVDSALALDPKYPPANYNAACIMASKGDFASAVKHLARSIAAKEEFFVELAKKDKDFDAVGGGDAVVAAALNIVHPEPPKLDASRVGRGVVSGHAEPGATIEAKVSPDLGPDMLSSREDVYTAVADQSGRFAIEVPPGSTAVVRTMQPAEAGLDPTFSKPVVATA